MTTLLLAWCASMGIALAQEPAPPTADLRAIFARFDHGVHERVMTRQGLGCTACHQVGGAGDPRLPGERLDEAYMTPPAAACHYCHNPPPNAPRVGPSQCGLCHDVVEPPPGHGAGWVDRHGQESRFGLVTCRDCHRDGFCVACHTRRQSVSFEVHDRTWIAVHGIAARVNPTECGTCHLQHDCESCHTGAGRQP